MKWNRNTNMHVFLLFFFFIPLANTVHCDTLLWMSDLLSNVLPHFVVASFGLRLCEAKSSLICYVQIFLGALRWIVQWTGHSRQSRRRGRRPTAIGQTRPDQRSLRCWICLLMVGCSCHCLRMVSFDIRSCNYTPRIWRRHHNSHRNSFTYSKHLYSHINACGEAVILLLEHLGTEHLRRVRWFYPDNTACMRKKHQKTWIDSRVASQRWNLLIREKCLQGDIRFLEGGSFSLPCDCNSFFLFFY